MSIALAAVEQTPGQRYKTFVSNLKALSYSADPKHKALVKAANEELCRLRHLSPGAVHNNSTLANVSIQYANEDFIGEQLMPPVTVAKLSDIYYIYDKRNRLAYPDDSMGARSSANEVIESRSTATYSCVPRALKNYVDALTVANQDAPLNEMIDLVQAVAEGIAFKREQRIATILTTGSNFSGNTAAIGAANRWDTAGGGNPIKDIQDAIAAMWNGRGPGRKIAYCSLAVWNVLSRHPAILDLFKYNGSSPGLATPNMVATFMGLDGLLVGKAWNDTANDGQTAVYARMWTDVFGIVRVATNPGIRNASFGYTFRNGQVMTDEWYDQSLGTQGGWFGRVSTHEDHKVVAPDTGYLLTTVIS